MRLTVRDCATTLAIIIVGLGGTHLRAQNSSQFRDWKASALSGGGEGKPAVACASLVSQTGYEFSILSAAVIPATSDTPEYCRVTGLIQPEVRFEVNLPASWNGRLYMFGNGGYAGEALDAPGRVTTARRALARGFAAVQTNTGHDATAEPLGSFAASPQKFVDYASRAVHVTLMTAKRLLQAYYNAPARHAYWDGCSTGGRQGLIEAQRFPDDFDGILAGAPVLDFSGTMISYSAIQRALTAASIAPAKLRILADAVYAKCDAADGVKDGVIDDPRTCRFSPSADLPHCSGDTDGADCFTTAQVHAVESVYGAVRRNGSDFFPGWPPGAEISAAAGGPSGWMPWFVSQAAGRPIQANFGETYFRFMAFGSPKPQYDWLSFNLEGDLDKIDAARTLLDATNPDLSRFKARGGRMITYFGWADPALNPMMGVRYYESVMKQAGTATADFYRLFMVPGMFHCGGGIGTSVFDAFTPLVEWVEKGAAPQTIPAARVVDGKSVRTRPLCPYPQVAKYKGSGSVDEAANFSCAAAPPISSADAGRGPASRP
ncbi:MAG TPA: tannase/feruloyl esterase family alpha/beta hydrolase [Vicinamibacterales bacterium]|nr:tannase/feruloyl esterase family alpha/beta hydrolase [Vicinamibacterales bacterium]